MDDFSAMFAGLSISPGVAAILGAGLLIAIVYFADWLTNMVATFFDDDENDGGAACDFCGESGLPHDWMQDFDGMWMCGACARDDSRWSANFLSGEDDDDDED